MRPFLSLRNAAFTTGRATADLIDLSAPGIFVVSTTGAYTPSTQSKPIQLRISGVLNVHVRLPAVTARFFAMAPTPARACSAASVLRRGSTDPAGAVTAVPPTTVGSERAASTAAIAAFASIRLPSTDGTVTKPFV